MLKFARQSLAVGHNGRVVRITQDEAWHADDPFVRAHPELFADVPLRIKSTVDRGVEQATAAPGERRTVKRG